MRRKDKSGAACIGHYYFVTLITRQLFLSDNDVHQVG